MLQVFDITIKKLLTNRRFNRHKEMHVFNLIVEQGDVNYMNNISNNCFYTESIRLVRLSVELMLLLRLLQRSLAGHFSR